MKQTLRPTNLQTEIDRKILEISEKLLGGFTIGERKFPGLTIKARQSMLVMLEQILFFAIVGTRQERSNPYELIQQFNRKQLSGSLWATQYSPKVGAEIASKQFENVSFSESHMAKMREYCAALGIFTIEEREFVRGAGGRFIPGVNKGKKYASWLYEIDFEQLALVACALIQTLKNETVHNEEGLDAWTVLKPEKGCALLACLWQRLNLKGTIFSPKIEEKGDTTKDIVHDQYIEVKATVQKVEATIYEKEHLANQNKAESKSMSRAFWDMLEADRTFLKKLKTRVQSLHRRLVQDFGLAIEEISAAIAPCENDFDDAEIPF